MFILNKPKIKKIFNDDNINKKEITILSLFDKTKSEIKKPPVEIIVNDRVNLSNILKSVKFKKNKEIKNKIAKA